MKSLSLSDITVPFIYSTSVRQRFTDVDVVFGCGDLAYYYLEFVTTVLNAPLFYVRGNHDKVVEYGAAGQRTGPAGGTDLHRRVIQYKGMLLAGVEGSLRYRAGMFQYSQEGMFRHVLSIVPRVMVNRLLYGRFLDVFLTHSPSWGVHDADDLPHQGIKAFGWFVRVFQPAYHFHGHVHIYNPDTIAETRMGRTCVINTFGFRETELSIPAKSSPQDTRKITAS